MNRNGETKVSDIIAMAEALDAAKIARRIERSYIYDEIARMVRDLRTGDGRKEE